MATAPISDTDTRNDYVATAGQTSFAYTFWIKDDDDLDVYKNGSLLTKTSHYTISAVQSVTGGNVVLTSGASLNDDIAIVYNPAIERQTEFQTSGSFRATSLNLELSYIISLLQYLNTKLDRVVKLEDSVSFSGSLSLEDPAGNASKVLVLNATEDGFEFGPETTDISAVATYLTEIDTVAGSIANVNTAAGSIANINTAAGSIANINTVAGSIANVNAVAGDIADVSTVAGSIADVSTVAGDIADVSTVAGISADVATVAANDADISTVATSIADVNTVGTNIADVQAVAAALAAAIATGITVDDSAFSFLSGDNVQEVLDNLDNSGASQAEAEAGAVNTKFMTPLRTAQAIAALAPEPAGKTFIGQEIFTANGTFTKANYAGATHFECFLQAAGGGGGGADSSGAAAETAAGGGSGGQFAYAYLAASGFAANETVTIGAAGSAGTASGGNGGTASDSSIGTLLTAKGGVGGSGTGSAAAAGTVGAGGIAVGGGTGDDYELIGTDGQSGFIYSGGSTSENGAIGGMGGNSHMGGGGRGGQESSVSGSTAAQGGNIYGGGGGGGASQTTSGMAGGAGAGGICIIRAWG